MIHNFKLGELFEIQIGKTPARGDKKMWDLNKKSNNIWLSIRDLNQTDANGYISDSAEYITDDGAKLVKIIPKNTLLLSFKLTLGRTAITKIPLRTNEAIAALLPKTDQCNIRYLKYYFEYFNFVKFAGNDFKVKGLTLNKKKLADIPIPVPSLQEQEKIVERLDKVFENIDATLSNNALKKKLYNDYFESISWDEVFENQKFAKNPISDFFELDPSKSEILNENLDEVSFIPMADVDELIFEVDSKQIKDYKQVKKGYKYFANGDFLLAKITPCFENGKMGQVNNLKNKIGFGSTEFIVHRSNGKILNEWLYLIYSNSRIRKKLATTMSGAVGHKRVSKETISNLQISSPTIEEQKKIIDKLFMIKKIVDKKISIIDKETFKYSSLKKSILNKEFSYE